MRHRLAGFCGKQGIFDGENGRDAASLRHLPILGQADGGNSSLPGVRTRYC
jgi:hypothetical protein